MGQRKVVVRQDVAESIASIAWYIESQGLVATAYKFTDAVYDYFIKLSNSIVSHSLCRDPARAMLGYKCIPYKKRYTVVFIETKHEVIICEFISSKLIHW